MLIEKVSATIEKEHLIENENSILVALSGGPDSVCLLHVLNELKKKYNLKLYAFHLNHRIRGISAHKDALFSLQFANNMDIPCFTLSKDIPQLAKENKTTIEEEARNQRYKAMFMLSKRLKIDKIAVAHNLDDQAETILMRIIRGTGLKGLKGMDYFRQDGIIRPLLDIDKKEIYKYCKINNLDPCIDETNFEEKYTRNNIRLNLIPYIEDNFSSKIKENLSRMSNVLREDNNFLESVAQKCYEITTASIDSNTIKLELDDNIIKDIAILKRLIRNTIFDLVGTLEGIEGVHLNDIVNLIKFGKAGSRINIPKGIIIYKNSESILFTTLEIKKDLDSFDYEINMDGITKIEEAGIQIDAKIMTKEKCIQLPTGQYTKAFDLNKIEGKLRVRNRAIGDKIKPIGLGGTKKVKDIFIDGKIPLEKRDRIPLIVDDQKILWVCGLKISEESKISETTDLVVRLSIKDL